MIHKQINATVKSLRIKLCKREYSMKKGYAIKIIGGFFILIKLICLRCTIIHENKR